MKALILLTLFVASSALSEEYCRWIYDGNFQIKQCIDPDNYMPVIYSQDPLVEVPIEPARASKPTKRAHCEEILFRGTRYMACSNT
jgi:hypothetical protein